MTIVTPDPRWHLRAYEPGIETRIEFGIRIWTDADDPERYELPEGGLCPPPPLAAASASPIYLHAT